MKTEIIATVFAPKASKIEAKADATTRVSREIQGAEAAKREEKTVKLRAARLAREMAEHAQEAGGSKQAPTKSKKSLKS